MAVRWFLWTILINRIKKIQRVRFQNNTSNWWDSEGEVGMEKRDKALGALGIRPLCKDNQYHVLFIKWKLFQAVVS